ncbi:hydroxyphenylacetyl-CoA thioesterase PaaI [uncultured Enterovirga sp.]|uniref:hydroxyphenylacetyl-CoA thioesterase PaaI n=1 Tax=uncultured Enterovirga sp. TaxID=2026352 RepID=UPI0035CA4C81
MSDAPDDDGPDLDLDLDAIARASADAMWAEDRASIGLGIKLIDVGSGYALLSMEVTEAMTNGHGTAHGGFIFALADSAFAFACNSHGDKAVAQHCTITYLRPGRLGDQLVASAHEVAREGRSGIYDINVSVGDETVAEFRGHSRTVGGRWV